MRALVAAAQESDDFLKDLYTERSKALNDSEKISPHGVILSAFCSHFAQFRGAQPLIAARAAPSKCTISKASGPGDPPGSTCVQHVITLLDPQSAGIREQ